MLLAHNSPEVGLHSNDSNCLQDEISGMAAGTNNQISNSTFGITLPILTDFRNITWKPLDFINAVIHSWNEENPLHHFKKAFKFTNFKEKSLTSFSVVMLHMCKRACTSTSRVPAVSETHGTSRAALVVFCTDNLCSSMRSLLPLRVWCDRSGTGFDSAGIWQGCFDAKNPILKAHGKTSREFTDWHCFI